MEEQIKRSLENRRRIDFGGSPPEGFWVAAKDWWRDAVTDSGSVKRNLAMLFGVTLAAIASGSTTQARCSCTMCWQGRCKCPPGPLAQPADVVQWQNISFPS
jgi:hypothetical protein